MVLLNNRVMKTCIQKISIISVLIIFFSSTLLNAQELTTSQPAYPTHLPGFYLGAQGGYLFKNKNLSTNKAYYLNEGYFAELMAGWRAQNGFAWSLALGRMDLKRKWPNSESLPYSIDAVDVLQPYKEPSIWEHTPFNGETFQFDDNTVIEKDKTDFSSWYALTGPEFWFGRKTLQGFISLQAGVGYTQMGYHYISGGGESSNLLNFDYYDVNGDFAGEVEVGVLDNSYSLYGTDEKTYDKFISDGVYQAQRNINFMARGTLGAEYFFTPQISAHLSASYWMMMSPKMASNEQSRGMYTFNGELVEGYKPAGDDDPFINFSTNQISGRGEYMHEREHPSKNLGYISANVGLRYWFGRKSKEVKREEVMEPVQITEPEVRKKELLVTVKDEPTGLALSGVQVQVLRNGEPYYSGITDENGALANLSELESGDFEIKGVLNDIETTIAYLKPTDFESESLTIHKTLLHKDLRFTLLGKTIDANNNGSIGGVKTTLTNEGNGGNNFQNSNTDGVFKYQLEQGSDYSVFAEHQGYFSNRETVSTKGLDRSKTLYVDLRLGLSELKEGSSFELKNIYYDFDKSNIRPDAARILDDLYVVLTEHPNMIIELSSHTDSRGSDSYNLKLSQQRADAAVAYLVKKGIEKYRLQPKGYGETRLVNHCENGVECSEEEHQANRRTEIMVIKR